MLYLYSTKEKIKMHNVQIRQKGFTLIEILLVIALIAVLAGIVIFAINVPKQLADSRNAQRRSDVAAILNAIYQYSLDNGGSLPGAINNSTGCLESAGNEICATSGSACAGRTDLSALTDSQKYLVAIPVDPYDASGNATDYYVHYNSNSRVTVCAPAAENGAAISLTR
jgi:prepilin-type N-terminal cleavage/methylation domain-containing protein